MASQRRPMEHRHYRIRGRGTRRHKKIATALGKGRGEKQLHKPGAEVSSCGLCEWVVGADRKTHRPVEVQITGTQARFASCRAGHKWRIL